MTLQTISAHLVAFIFNVKVAEKIRQVLQRKRSELLPIVHLCSKNTSSPLISASVLVLSETAKRTSLTSFKLQVHNTGNRSCLHRVVSLRPVFASSALTEIMLGFPALSLLRPGFFVFCCFAKYGSLAPRLPS